VGTLTLGKIQYTNKLRRAMVFDIVSSRKDLMKPLHSTVTFRGLET